MMKLKILWILIFLLLPIASAFGQEASGRSGNSNAGLIAIGVGLAVGLGALGTAIAQARIGSAGLGSVAEKPESLGIALIFFLLPETLVIFGMVIAFLLLGKL